MLLNGTLKSLCKQAELFERAAAYTKRVFVATAVATDDEMADRIALHQEDRGEEFATVEEPMALASALTKLPADTDVAVVDCLTVWLGNLFHHEDTPGENAAELTDFVATIGLLPYDVIIVSNELGMGVVPDNAMARQFRDAAGRLNQQVAEAADEVVFMVSGIAQVIKENRK